jgi:hypothetical protein
MTLVLFLTVYIVVLFIICFFQPEIFTNARVFPIGYNAATTSWDSLQAVPSYNSQNIFFLKERRAAKSKC